MKWLLRIFGLLLLIILLAAAGAWFAFPWYAQRLVDRALPGEGIRVKLIDPGRPGPDGLAFGGIDAVVQAKPDSCTGIAPIYHLSIRQGKISWRFKPSASGTTALLTVKADSVNALQQPTGIRFRDRDPLLNARLELNRKGGSPLSVSPDSVTYAVRKGVVETGALKLDGISYDVLLTKSAKWVQQPALFRAESLMSNGVKAPLTGFQARFGLARKPDKPCTLFFNDCSVDLFGIRASTPEIEYSLRTKRTAFTLHLENLPLERLATLAGPRKANPSVSGAISGVIPLESVNKSVRITNGMVKADPGTLLVWKGDNGKPLFSFDAGGRKGGPPLVSGLNAAVTLDLADDKLSKIRLESLSMKLLGGSISSTPVTYDTATGSASGTVKMRDIPLFDRLRLQGAFQGSMKGSVSGTIPLSINREGVALRHATLSSPGEGKIVQRVAKKAPKTEAEPFTKSVQEVTWGFSAPYLVLDRERNGRMKIGFALKELKRTADGGEMILADPKGTIGIPAAWGKNPVVSLSDFSAGFFDGTVSVKQVDYNLSTRQARTVVRIDGIPLQKLLDLQGTKKIFATGNVRGEIPFMLDGDSFSIPKGGMDSEQSGKIIYTSSPEERAMANPGMRITYEALTNFLYSELLSSIAMTPDGESTITLQLKGHNPDFQNGREVILNLNIQQNLLDLFRSLSISSGIEEAISEKVMQKSRKK